MLIVGRYFYDQPINDQINRYYEIRKIAKGQGDDYATGCFLDYQLLNIIYWILYRSLPTKCSWSSQRERIRSWFQSYSTNLVLWNIKN